VRREFQLPEFDIAYLDASGWQWQTLKEGSASWLLIDHFAVPEGYNHSEVTVALRIEPGYPDVQIDMVYFHSPLARTDRKHIGAIDSMQVIAGVSFQRWSRHRTGENPWRPGVDDVSTHLALVSNWLKREFDK
jgi:hypothetical protein